ncbi:MAG: diacylglycerol kinase family protein [Bacteroidetes bacterium]|nr:diacylglycerol kinase family protein [Bacteroidota bacterium]
MKFFKMIKSFVPAVAGLTFLIKNENNFKFQLVAFFSVLTLGLSVGINRYEWLFILVSCALVLVAEGINTAIEKLADQIELSKNSKIKVIKDVSAAAVFLSAIFSLITGLIIFYPYLKKLFFGSW